MIAVTFRPIDRWPGERNPVPRRSPFSSPWSRTLELLDRELAHLGADNVIVQVALREDQIRLDGWPRSGAYPDHPGVIVAFDSHYGPLKYACDAFRSYEDNVRAIGLGLESLRRVDRYGITKRGEQYTGWRALPAGGNVARGRELVKRYGNVHEALKATHPDRHGDPEDFRAVVAFRDSPEHALTVGSA